MLQATRVTREATVALARRRERERDAEHDAVLDGEPAEVERGEATRSPSFAAKAKISSTFSQSGRTNQIDQLPAFLHFRSRRIRRFHTSSPSGP